MTRTRLPACESPPNKWTQFSDADLIGVVCKRLNLTPDDLREWTRKDLIHWLENFPTLPSLTRRKA